jgi:hypothetical protein
LRQRWIRAKGNEVEGAQAHCNINVVPARTDSADDLAENARAIFKRAAVFPRAGVRAKKLMQQVAVAMLDIDEVCADLRCEPRHVNVVADEFSDRLVREHRGVVRNSEFAIEEWDAGTQCAV